MILIRHKVTGEPLLEVQGDSLAGATLGRAVLLYADLQQADLRGAYLGGADLSHAHLSKTVIARCRDLHQSIGLDQVDYLSPSSIDIETLRYCIPHLGPDFLSSLGLEATEVEELRSLFSVQEAPH